MVNDLLKLVQQVAGDSIEKDKNIPKDQTKNAIQSITDGVFGGLKQEALGGGLGNIINMFSSKGNNISDSITKTVQASVVNSLMDKIGIKNTAAKSIANQLVPQILALLSKFGGDSKNKDFNAGELLAQLTGGKTKGLDLKNILDQGIGNGDGKFDLSDLTSLLGNAGNKNKSSGGGGLLDALGGLLGGNKK